MSSIEWTVVNNDVTALGTEDGGTIPLGPSGPAATSATGPGPLISADGQAVIYGLVGAGGGVAQNTTVISNLLSGDALAVTTIERTIDGVPGGGELGFNHGISKDGNNLFMTGDFTRFPIAEVIDPPAAAQPLCFKVFRKNDDGLYEDVGGTAELGAAGEPKFDTFRQGTALDVGTNKAVYTAGGPTQNRLNEPLTEDQAEGFVVGATVWNLDSDNWAEANPEDVQNARGGFYPEFDTGLRTNGEAAGLGAGTCVKMTEDDSHFYYLMVTPGEEGAFKASFDIVATAGGEGASLLKAVASADLPSEVNGAPIQAGINGLGISQNGFQGTCAISRLDDGRMIVAQNVQTATGGDAPENTDHILIYEINGSSATLVQTISNEPNTTNFFGNVKLVKTSDSATIKGPAPDEGVILSFSTGADAPVVRTFNLDV